jgi:hypothetical protein
LNDHLNVAECIEELKKEERTGKEVKYAIKESGNDPEDIVLIDIQNKPKDYEIELRK